MASDGSVAVEINGLLEGVSSRSDSTFSSSGKSIDTRDLDSNWLASIRKKIGIEPRVIKSTSTTFLCSIHRLPKRFRRHDVKAYIPQIVSIGPFHYARRKKDLKAMEEHKWKYLHDVLRQQEERTLENMLSSVKELEETARECYSEKINLDSNSFVEMLVLDGCFLIELFRREWFEEYQDDPIFELEWLKHALVIDLLKLENQFPFFILEHLSEMLNILRPSPAEGALFFLEYWDFFKKLLPQTTTERNECQGLHLLHLLHTSILPVGSIAQPQEEKSLNMIRCASQLQDAGIRFKKVVKTDGFFDINFQEGLFNTGVISIPPFIVEGMTNPVFFNLTCFEHSYRYCRKYVTAYVAFMDCLINSARDVKVLSQEGILDNWLSCDEEVATLINNLGNDLIIDEDDFYLFGTFNDINRCYGSFVPKMMGTFKRDYFKTPWSIISVLAAILLLFLAFTQSFFSSFPKFALHT